MVALKKLFVSDDWAQHKLILKKKIRQEVEKLMFDHPYWAKMEKVVSLYESLYIVLQLVGSKVVPMMPFVYKLIQMMKKRTSFDYMLENGCSE